MESIGNKLKSIAIIIETIARQNVATSIKNDLDEVFKNQVKVNFYYFESLKDGMIIDDDVVLVTNEERAVKAKKYVNDAKKILIVQRSFKESAIYDVLKIPKGANVLVVNYPPQVIMKTISILHQIGVEHINLIPYQGDEKTYDNVKIAITPGETDLIPDFIETVIDVGNRCLDFNTVAIIIKMLHIDNDRIAEGAINYSKQVIDLNNGLKTQYIDFYNKNVQLNKIIQISNEGILVCDKNYVVLNYNKKFADMLEIEQNRTGETLKSLLGVEMFSVLSRYNLNKEYLEINDEYTLVTKSELIYFNEIGGYCFNFCTSSYIKDLEDTVIKEIRKRKGECKYIFDDIVHESKVMDKCIQVAKKIADCDSPVLILGESGTGKELLIQSIHNYSQRSNKPFVAINCAALTDSLLESELFGYDKGSFTGALKEGKIGVFEQAQHGTLFLDEIGDITYNLQTKLLRVLQEKQIRRVGSNSVINIDVRIIAATNKDLNILMMEGKFREDLYYRINTFLIKMPSLRERKEDILILAKYFLNDSYKLLSDDDKKKLLEYSWFGNVRELKNAMDYFLIMNELNDDIKLYNQENKLKNNKHQLFGSVINKNYNTNYSYLENYNDIDSAYIKYSNNEELLKILVIINNYSIIKNGIGRYKLMEELYALGININESRLKKILNVLSNDEVIITYPGRQGSKITNKGIEFLNKLKSLDKKVI